MSGFSPRAHAGFRRAHDAARVKPRSAGALVAVLMLAALPGCGSARRRAPRPKAGGGGAGPRAGPGPAAVAPTVPGPIPPQLDPRNVYAADRAGNLSPTVRADPAL